MSHRVASQRLYGHPPLSGLGRWGSRARVSSVQLARCHSRLPRHPRTASRGARLMNGWVRATALAAEPALITVAFFRNKHATVPQRRELPLDDLALMLTYHSTREAKDGPMFACVRYKPGATR